MTNKEAIRILGLECDEWDISHCTASERREAFGMAIKALQELDKNLTKPNNSNQEVAKDTNVLNNDTISRQAAINVLSIGKDILCRVLDDMDVVGADREKYSWGLGLIESYIKDIAELPPIQPETCDTCKHGYFGDDCDNCCVGYPNRYERRTDD